MLALTCFFVLALASASKLNIRQTTNTNAAINSIVDTLDEDLRHVGPTISSDTTIGQQISNLEAAFSKATQRLSSTPAGAGSTTGSPTNDEISNTLGDAIQLVATSLSGIIGTGAVPGFPSMVATFDPILVQAVKEFNTTAPNSLSYNYVHILGLYFRND